MFISESDCQFKGFAVTEGAYHRRQNRLYFKVNVS